MILRKFKWWLQWRRREAELAEELRFHLEQEAEDRRDRGLSSDEAAWAARRDLGNVTLVKESTRAMWTWDFVEQFGQDLRYAWRAMGHSKAFTAAAALSLALGIGANTAIYSFIDAVMMRALPVTRPEELVLLNWRAKADPAIVHGHWGDNYDEPGGGTVSPNYPYPAFELLRDQNHVFSSLFAHASAGRLNVWIDGQAELALGQYVTGDFFQGLGVSASAGRLIGREDDRPGAPNVAVLTYDYWRSRFGSDAGVLGKAIQVNGVPFTIAGVAAPEFFGVAPGTKPSIFIPMAVIGLTDSRPNWPEQMRNGTFYWIEPMARLKPGVTRAQAEAEVGPLFHGFVESTATKARERANLPTLILKEGGSGVDALRRQYSELLWILMTMVGLILTIACANVANLLLARAEARKREMAVRLSLGAGRLRVIRQLLTESVLLAFISGVLGVGVSVVGIRFLTVLFTDGRDDFGLKVGLDWRVLGFTLAVALMTGLLFGFAPALHATKVDVAPMLKDVRLGRTRRVRLPFGLSQVLVVGQIALSLLLVMAAGLFVRTLVNLHSVQLGFNSENVLLFNLDAGKAGLKGTAIYLELLRRFGASPGVRGATVSDLPLVGGWTSRTSIELPGVPKPPEGQRGPSTAFALVGSTFFEAMEIPIVLGRSFNERDRAGTQAVAVINEVFAKKYFPDVSPLGRHYTMGGEKNRVDLEIVGVAKNARYNSLKRQIPEVTYMPFLQDPNPDRPHEMFFEVRTLGDPLAIANTVRAIVHEVAPAVPMGEVTTQAQRIDRTILQERTFASLCTCFGVLALVIAFVGLYGSVSYSVVRRTSEIGIRMALGAQRWGVVWMVLRGVLLLVAVGFGVALPVAFLAGRMLESLLFGIKANDPVALIVAAAVLAAAAVGAGYLPARRGSRIDPMVALRNE